MPADKIAPSGLPRSIVESVPTAAKVAKTLREVEDQIASLSREMKKLSRGGAVAAARGFVALHRLKARMEETEKAFSTLFEDYKVRVIPGIFEQEGVPHVPLAEGFRVGVSHQTRASIRAGAKDQAYEWLRTHGLEHLITEVVNASTLSSAAKHEMEENNVDFPEDLFNVALVPNTSVTVTRAGK